MRQQRRNLVTSGIPDLVARALADGATTVYSFAESSGVLINRAAPGTRDLSVDAAVTRSYAGLSGPDQLAYRFPNTGSNPLYGHAQGTRENVGGGQAVSFEAVLKVVTAPGAARTLLHLDMDAGSTLSDVNYSDTNTNILASISVQGQPINNQNLTAPGSGNHLVYAHYVWQWNGSTFRTWRNGASVATVAIGGGSLGLQTSGSPYNMAFGGFYNFGGSNTDCAIDFFALYSSVHLTAGQIAAHSAAAGV